MPIKIRAKKYDTASARLKLPFQKRPHWHPLSPRLTLGCRRNQGPCSWVRKLDGKEVTIGFADDLEPANNESVLSFEQAVEKCFQALRGDMHGPAKTLTIDKALSRYEDDLKARDAKVYNARHCRYHLTPGLLSKPLALITEQDLKNWRNSLAKTKLAASTVNRICSGLRAALELADKSRSH